MARSTVDPLTLTGSITANGVTRPVRPTFTWMSSSRVVTSSGGYLKAMAHRGARLVEPSWRCSAIWSTLTTTPSISYGGGIVPVLGVVGDVLADPGHVRDDL